MKLRGLRSRSASTTPAKSDAAKEATTGDRLKQAGQIIAIFALMLTALIGLVGIAIDVTYAWREELRVQRAADAAALAGVVYLPGNVGGGTGASVAEATKNGFTTNAPTTTVSAGQDPSNIRQMDVSITTKVPTFFVRVFGIDTFTVTRSSKAVYILPVPMGSPDSYYGMFGPYKMCSSGTGSSCTTASVPLKGPDGETVTNRGFWASMLTQGAEMINGDAYGPIYMNAPNNGTNPQHDTVDYYDYAISMPAGSSNGHVYIFDPVFCAGYINTSAGKQIGIGDQWFSGSNAVNSYFKLYNTNNQPYNLAAHTLLGSSGSFFTGMKGYDPKAGASSVSGGKDCSSASTTGDWWYYHNKWFDLTSYIGTTLSGGVSGTTYRLRTTTAPGNSSDADGVNQFAIFVEDTGTAAQVYGIGAMQMYTPLQGGTSSVFYLAQIDAESGAGKTVEIQLWDPGDTNQTAQLKILQPTASGWSAVPTLNYTCTKIATGSSASCPSGSAAYIETSTGTTSHFNGSWLTIDIVLPTTYTAPQQGWWKIQYDMLGSSGSLSSDETTWQVNIRGNPVHLIP
jgi:hypothetical protein